MRPVAVFGLVDGVWGGLFLTQQSKTILARSCAWLDLEVDQPKTLCNLAGLCVVLQGGFQLPYERLLQRING